MKLPRLATYSVKGETKYGAVLEGGIVDLSARYAKDYPTLREVIAAGKLASLAEEAAGRTPVHALSEITWLPPVPAPEKIICIGVNYPDRNAEYKDGQDAPKYPSMFMRSPRSFVGHDTPLVRPRASEQLDYEGEIVLVIGKPGRHITESAALDHIAALTLCNEGSVRDWLRHAKFNVTQGKNFDSSGSLGPWLVPYTRETQIADISAHHACQRRAAAGRPYQSTDVSVPLSHQLHLDLRDARSRRHHRHGHADRRRCAVRSAALSEAGRCHRGRSRRHRHSAQRRRRRSLNNNRSGIAE